MTTLKRDLCLFLISFIAFLICNLINSAGMVWTEHVAARGLDSPPLQDVVFEINDNLGVTLNKHWNEVPDYALFTLTSCVALLLIFGGLGSNRLVIIRRYLWCASFYVLMRGICLFSTQLPNPKSTTWYKQFERGNFIIDTLLVCFRQKLVNYDYFFSGHTGYFALFHYFILKYRTGRFLKHWLFGLFVRSIIYFNLYVIINTKFHYTIDVIAGWLLVIFVCHLYHLNCVDLAEKNKNKWWFRLTEGTLAKSLTHFATNNLYSV